MSSAKSSLRWLDRVSGWASRLRHGTVRPKLLVIGVGGAGGNAVNNMIAGGLASVDFCVMNTDAQALARSGARSRLRIGSSLTRGLGAGSRVDVGRAAAEESLHDIAALL